MRKVVIMSGISGSGKSRYAKLLISTHIDLGGASSAYSSADSYFMCGDVYNFDASKLSLAHGKCFRDFITHLQQECELVVVDNTNTTESEISPYMLGASAFGYEAELITLQCATTTDVEVCASRNAHKVPLSVCSAQDSRILARRLPPYWKASRIPVTR